MLSGDGLIVRVRPQSATFGLDELAVLADAARRFGNGHLDLTRRANLQIRGVSDASLAPLQDVIASLGFLDGSAESEAVRNIMVNPLAGIDPAEVLDVRDMAQDLARRLASDRSIWGLPSKFGFVVDGGGVLSLAEQRADVRLAATAHGLDVAIAIGIETRVGTEWLGSTSPGNASAAAIETGLAFIDAASGKRQRMRDLSDEDLASIRSSMKPRLDRLHENPRNAVASLKRHIGLIELGADRFAAGIAAPFGRVESDQLCKLTGAMAAHGVKEVRLSPWRALYAEVSDRQSGQSILDAARRDGLIIDAGDPLLRIEACPGAPGCRSTTLDTRGDGRRLAQLLPGFGFAGTVHVSGCAKGCARSGPAELVLVGAERRYGIVRGGTAQDRPAHFLSFAEAAADPGKIFDTDRGCRYG